MYKLTEFNTSDSVTHSLSQNSEKLQILKQKANKISLSLDTYNILYSHDLWVMISWLIKAIITKNTQAHVILRFIKKIKQRSV